MDAEREVPAQGDLAEARKGSSDTKKDRRLRKMLVVLRRVVASSSATQLPTDEGMRAIGEDAGAFT